MSGMYTTPANQPPICIVSTANSLDGMLQRFWEMDNLDHGRALTLDEQRCEDHFRRTVTRERDGRYVVRLPVRDDRLPYLGDAHQLAQRRLLSTERRFRTDPNLQQNYHQFMEEYARLGHMEPSVYTGIETIRPRFLAPMVPRLREPVAPTTQMANRNSQRSGPRRIGPAQTGAPSSTSVELGSRRRNVRRERWAHKGGASANSSRNVQKSRDRSLHTPDRCTSNVKPNREPKVARKEAARNRQRKDTGTDTEDDAS
ncbi:uncharacterized protein LOC134288170 [Aedes albopictus]|uniref:Uncharacterized protein n=1 Tax=Aedes albopictus TaxID=7160 RepID=A0ABM2A7D7_AEDAL